MSVGCYSRDRVVRFVERALLPAVNSAPVLDETCFDLSNALRRILKVAQPPSHTLPYNPPISI